MNCAKTDEQIEILKSAARSLLSATGTLVAGWRRGVVAIVVRRMNEVTLRRARLVLGWVTVFGRVYHTVCNQPTRSTQPCIPPGSLNRVPASAGGKGWNVTSVGWQVTLCDPIWHVSSSSGVATSVSELLYPCYFTLLTFFLRE